MPRKGKKIETIIAATISLFIVMEAGLQLRAQWQTGRSVFTALAGQKRIVVDTETGVRRLAANRTFRGADIEVQTNAYGLRSPEISLHHAENTVRIAVLGASSIYGAEAATNADTIPARLERALKKRIEGRKIEVINAGVPGSTIENIHLLLSNIILPLSPNIVVFYPGFQQISGACRPEQRVERQSAPWIGLPNWSLVYDLIVKNTRFLREKPGIRPVQSPPKFEPGDYRQALEKLIEEATTANAEFILTTAARGYREEFDLEENHALARNSLNFADCLTPTALIEATALFNPTIRQIAADRDAPIIDLARQVPGGWRYFVDGNHLNDEGKRLSVNILVERLEAYLNRKNDE